MIRGTVFEGQCAAVCLRNLAAQNQSNAGASWFGGEKGHEQIAGV